MVDVSLFHGREIKNTPYDSIKKLTFSIDQSQIPEVKDVMSPKKIHGLRKLDPKKAKLPFQLSENQGAYTCMCGEGGMTITNDPQEWYSQHLTRV